ncbi:hypothetical protein [Pseudanabaena sp. FACHB-1998]|nr:hypothetical protein [Pseudanabaena sp. FACHB-1998]
MPTSIMPKPKLSTPNHVEIINGSGQSPEPLIISMQQAYDGI